MRFSVWFGHIFALGAILWLLKMFTCAWENESYEKTSRTICFLLLDLMDLLFLLFSPVHLFFRLLPALFSLFGLFGRRSAPICVWCARWNVAMCFFVRTRVVQVVLLLFVCKLNFIYVWIIPDRNEIWCKFLRLNNERCRRQFPLHCLFIVIFIFYFFHFAVEWFSCTCRIKEKERARKVAISSDSSCCLNSIRCQYEDQFSSRNWYNCAI